MTILFAGEFTDLRGPRLGTLAVVGLLVFYLLLLVAFGRVVVGAIAREGIARYGRSAVAVGFVFFAIAPIPLLSSIKIDSPAIQCGRPLLARSDFDAIPIQPMRTEKIEKCESVFHQRRVTSVSLLISGFLFCLAGLGLLAINASRNRFVSR
jgi:hypothetical protein